MVNPETLDATLLMLLKKVAPDSQPDQLKPSDPLMATLQMDSYDFLQFIISIDKELHINIPEEDYGKVMTLAEMVQYIKGKNPVRPI